MSNITKKERLTLAIRKNLKKRRLFKKKVKRKVNNVSSVR